MFNPLGRRRGAAALAACSAIAIVASISSAYAQEQQRAFNIPAQPLSSALLEFSRQSDIAVGVDPALVNGRQAPTVQGQLTPSEALNRLLTGSGLSAQQRPGGGFVLADTSSPTRLGAADPAASSYAADEEIIVTGTRIRGGNAGGSPIYVFGRDDIENSGAASVQQLFSTLPQNFTGGTSETAASVQSIRNGGGNNVTYANSINLRGLGVDRPSF